MENSGVLLAKKQQISPRTGKKLPQPGRIINIKLFSTICAFFNVCSLEIMTICRIGGEKLKRRRNRRSMLNLPYKCLWAARYGF
jgi:hypothetical protein